MKLSVIIASCVEEPYLVNCLASLAEQTSRFPTETIIATRASSRLVHSVQERFPDVRIIRRPAGESVPDLRRAALLEARGDYVAIIEEHCIADPNWIQTIFDCIDRGFEVVGGPVAPSRFGRLTDWVVYYTEYNSYMPPVEAGETTNICGANCLYRRDLLIANLPESGSGYWEADLNNSLLRQGKKFHMEPKLIVHHTGPFGLTYYLEQRFLFSRAFAGFRRKHLPVWKQAAYLMLSPLLVPLLVARIGSRVWAKNVEKLRFLQALPMFVPVGVVYVFGEVYGYLTGPGDSLSRIE